MADLLLVLEEPVDRRLVVHRLADRLERGLAMRAEQHVVVDLQLRIGHRRIEPDRHDDADIVHLRLRYISLADAVEHGIRDRRLHRAHEDVRVAGVGSGVFAHHQRGGPHLHVAVEDRPNTRMPLHLITDEVGNGVAHRAVEFADHHLRLSRAPRLVSLHERLAGPHDDLLACHKMPPWKRRSAR